jgi:hypothetical protein
VSDIESALTLANSLLGDVKTALFRNFRNLSMRAEANFSRLFNVMLPVQSPAQKINRLALTPNQHYNLRYPGPRRGALTIVTNVGAGCGGRGSVGRAGLVAGQALPVSDRGAQDERRCNRLRKRFGGRARSAKPLGEGSADGKTVWSWHPLLVSSRRRLWSAEPGLTGPFNRR